MKINEKLSLIKQELGVVNKGKKNDFAHFTYVDINAIFAKITPLLKIHEVTIDIESVVPNIEMCNIFKEPYYDFNLSIESEDEKQVRTYTFPADDKSKMMKHIQATGSMYTYAQRYIYGAIFSIQTEVDPDSGKPEDKQPQKPWLNPSDKTAWPNAVGALKNGKTMKDIKTHYSISKVNEDKLMDESI